MEEHKTCDGCIFQWDCRDEDRYDWGGCKYWTDNERDRFPEEESSNLK